MRTEDKYFVPKKICENMYYRQTIEKGFTSVAPVPKNILKNKQTLLKKNFLLCCLYT